MNDQKDLKFPSGFLWGTATSAHQVEGNNVGNDWWEWEQAGKNPPSGQAADQYNRYESDFEFAKQMNNNLHRLSIEWSRIEPEEGQWDMKEIEHYKKVFAALKKRNIKIMLTLHHFTNPQWFARLGGWENRKSSEIFARFVQFIAQNFQEDIDFWITLNEPMLYAMQSFYRGIWPPWHKSLFKFWHVINRLIEAHKLAYRVIHLTCDKEKRTNVGIAQNVVSAEAWPPESLLPNIFLPTFLKFWNHWFFKKSRTFHDFIGINYYFHYRIKINFGGIKLVDPKSLNLETSDIGWETYPTGFYEAISQFQSYLLPIYITENGIATKDENQRIKYLISHLAQLHKAIQNGAKVKGYCYWSLLDNFEWEKGLGPRFGLVKVDFTNQNRSITPAGKIYGEIAKHNKISPNIYNYIERKSSD